jgi:hypothetical protein
MAGLQDDPQVPREDWRCMEVADIREKRGAPPEIPCEMCGTARIRFVHVMDHDNYDETLGVCADCAEKMTNDAISPKRVENQVRKKSAARDAWLAGRWYLSARENWVIQVDGINMGVFPVKFQPGLWSCRIENKFFKGLYPSIEEAKYALFEEYWKMRPFGRT